MIKKILILTALLLLGVTANTTSTLTFGESVTPSPDLPEEEDLPNKEGLFRPNYLVMDEKKIKFTKRKRKRYTLKTHKKSYNSKKYFEDLSFPMHLLGKKSIRESKMIGLITQIIEKR